MGDTELVLKSRGKLENLTVSSFSGYKDDIRHDTVEVSVHAVSRNFKNVLNIILPDQAAYVGHDAPPLPGADFSGVVMEIPTETNLDQACPFFVEDKVYVFHWTCLGLRPVFRQTSLQKCLVTSALKKHVPSRQSF